jgi:sugar O-acyltransferase (sialic acid O-acetyltransferase NeuD family)
MEHSPHRLLILGTRTFAVEIADLASDIDDFQVVGFVENMEPDRCRETLENLPIIWSDELPKLIHTHKAVCGLATTFRSRFTDQVAAYGMEFATLIHPTARISATSSLGVGTIISVGVIIASHTHLGCHVIVNRGALVGHHTRIGNYVTIQPGANIAGACQIGDATYIGMGAIVTDHITIGTHSIIGAGAVVINDVPDNVLVVGVPARVAKENVAGK